MESRVCVKWAESIGVQWVGRNGWEGADGGHGQEW